jgi:hypothetical protein
MRRDHDGTEPNVTGARIVAADTEPQNWLAHGRTYSEQRFSPLARITTANVGQLGLAWSHDIKARTARGVEATSIVVDGVVYTTGAWSLVQPGPIGGHNWQPMSYSPVTGLVYLPATDGGFFFMAADPATFQRRPGVFWNSGLNPGASTDSRSR